MESGRIGRARHTSSLYDYVKVSSMTLLTVKICSESIRLLSGPRLAGRPVGTWQPQPRTLPLSYCSDVDGNASTVRDGGEGCARGEEAPGGQRPTQRLAGSAGSYDIQVHPTARPVGGLHFPIQAAVNISSASTSADNSACWECYVSQIHHGIAAVTAHESGKRVGRRLRGKAHAQNRRKRSPVDCI